MRGALIATGTTATTLNQWRVAICRVRDDRILLRENTAELLIPQATGHHTGLRVYGVWVA